jgi:hypothetical protein
MRPINSVTILVFFLIAYYLLIRPDQLLLILQGARCPPRQVAVRHKVWVLQGKCT